MWADYKLTQRTWDALWAEQGGCCAICRVVFAHPYTKSMKLSGVKCVVDHKHFPGERKGQCKAESVRGLLCFNCNTHLGAVREEKVFLKGALAYLEKKGLSTFDYEDAPNVTREAEGGRLSLAEQAEIYGFDPREGCD